MTVEEKIISHIEQNCTYPDGSPMMDEQTFYEGAKWGYSEAMRWRDPKEELPEGGVDVFVKVIRSGEYGEETIYTSSSVINNFYHSNDHNPFGCEGYYPAGYGGRVSVTVIGWRPIE